MAGRCTYLNSKHGVLPSICPAGFKKSGTVDLCKQAGRERLHDCGRNLSEPPTYVCQRPPVAHPGLLCTHRGGVRHVLITSILPFHRKWFRKMLCCALIWLQFFLLCLSLFCYVPRSTPTSPGFCTSRLCQGLEWMMSRLRVRWCPLTFIPRAPLFCLFFFCLQT